MKRDLQFPKPYQIVKKWKIWNQESLLYETFCVSKLAIWRQKWVANVRHGNSLVVRRVSPGRITVVLFWTKYAVPHKIKPGILKLTIRRDQSNLSIIFIFVSCEEKGYYRVVSVGQLSFDCRSYCALSRRNARWVVTVHLCTQGWHLWSFCTQLGTFLYRILYTDEIVLLTRLRHQKVPHLPFQSE